MKRLIFPVLALSLLLSGCAIKAAKPQNVIRAYCCDEGGALGRYTAPVQEGQSALEAAVGELNSGEHIPSGSPAMPEGVYITSCRIIRGRAQLHMNDAYMELENVEKTVADYAMVYTLFDFDEVLSVDIFCGSRIVSHGMTALNAELYDAGSEGAAEPVKLFLPGNDQPSLRPCTDYITVKRDESRAYQAAQLLLSRLDDVPDGTRVISAEISSGECSLDLSEELYAKEPDSPAQARLVISAIVNTLAYLPEVDSVTVRVNGLLMTGYGGYATAWPAEFDGKIIDLSD